MRVSFSAGGLLTVVLAVEVTMTMMVGKDLFST